MQRRSTTTSAGALSDQSGWSIRRALLVATARRRRGAVLVARALDAAPSVVADRRRRGAARRIGARRRGAALELFDVTTRLGGRAVRVRGALRAATANAARGGGRAIGVRRAAHAAPRRDVADGVVRVAIAVLIALDTRAGGRIAELRAVVPALRVVGALLVALVIAGPTRGLGGPAVGVVPARLTATGQAERIARPAVGVAEALHAAERGIAFPSAAGAGPTREAPAASDEPGVVALAPASDDDQSGEREGKDPVLHGRYGSVRAR